MADEDRGGSFLPLGKDDPLDEADDVSLGRTVMLAAPTQVVTAYGAASTYLWPLSTGAVVQGAASDLAWGNWTSSRHVTFTVRAPPILLNGNPFGIASGNVFGIYVKIETSLGGSARFDRTFLLPPGGPVTVRTFGRRVSVSAWLVAPLGAPAAECTGALTTEDVSPLGDLVALWVPSPGMASQGNITPISANNQRGYFLGCSGCLGAGGATGTPYWLMVFDRAPGTAPVAFDVPLLALGPLIGGQNTPFAFDRSLRPSVRFTQGLTWAISSAADFYQVPASVPVVRIDADYGV